MLFLSRKWRDVDGAGLRPPPRHKKALGLRRGLRTDGAEPTQKGQDLLLQVNFGFNVSLLTHADEADDNAGNGLVVLADEILDLPDGRFWLL